MALVSEREREENDVMTENKDLICPAMPLRLI
jgi:hypothetical protein